MRFPASRFLVPVLRFQVRGPSSRSGFLVPVPVCSAQDDADFYANGRSVWSGDREGKPIAVLYAWRNDETHGMTAECFAAAVATVAGIRPRFSAAAARETNPSNGNVERHDDAVERFPRRQDELGREMPPMIAFTRRGHEACPHSFDRTVQRWKIDRHFVVEPAVAPLKRSGEHAAGGASIITRANRIVPHRLHVR
jgi:hypothetical protein